MFASQGRPVQQPRRPRPGDDGAGKNDDIGSERDADGRQLRPVAPALPDLKALAAPDASQPRAAQRRAAEPLLVRGAGVYAFSRIDRKRRREYVVALNNSKAAASASVPTSSATAAGRRSTATARGGCTAAPTSGSASPSTRSRPSSTAPRSASRAADRAPSVSSRRRRPRAATGSRSTRERRRRLVLRGDVPAPRSATARWHDIGTDDNAPYRVFHDVSDMLARARRSATAPSCSTTPATRAPSAERSTTVSPPAITLEAPLDGQGVRGTATIRATACRSTPNYVMAFERSVNGGAFTKVGSDDSSPVYTDFDDVSALPDGGDRPLPDRPHLRARKDGDERDPRRSTCSSRR